MTKDAIAPIANNVIPAKVADALVNRVADRIEMYGMRRKYSYNVWDPSGTLAIPTVEWTETAEPLPRPSPQKLCILLGP
jgi:hypothetical protein